MYRAVPDSEADALDSNSDEGLDDRQSCAGRWHRQPWRVMDIVLLVPLVVLTFGTGLVVGRCYARDLDRLCSRHTSKYCTCPAV